MATRTLQNEIDDLRITLAEIEPNNSRWQDAVHLKKYVNDGRREFSKKSKALKASFSQVTTVGPTEEGGDVEARYDLDPTIIKIELIEWDGHKVQSAELDWFVETGRLGYGRSDPIQEGTPFKYRLVGKSIDLYFAPNLAKVLTIFSSFHTTDLEDLDSEELELTDDQWKIANKWAAHLALADDGRDSGRVLGEFFDGSKEHKIIANPRVGRGVVQSNFQEY